MGTLKQSDNILVVGAGAMGGGIAEVAAQAGHIVYLYDTQASVLEKAIKSIQKNQEFLVGKGKNSVENARGVLSRIIPLQSLSEAINTKLAIEAIVEKLEVKQAIFQELENLLSDDAILASNTSSISITAIAAKLKRPERLVGMHFFNPAARMKLVEVIAGLSTSEEVLNVVFDTAKNWGKIPVRAKSTPGFIVNRVARPYYAEGLRVINENALDIATIDAYMRDGCNFPMGPFELMDLIGHDVNFAVTNSVFDAYYKDRRFSPSIIQQELVVGGRLGKKSGLGFYDYREGVPKPLINELAKQEGGIAVITNASNKIINGLIQRLANSKVEVATGDVFSDQIKIGDAILALTNGDTATKRSGQIKIKNLIHFDCAYDFASSKRILLAKADQCSKESFELAVGTLQNAGYLVSEMDDIAGMLACRTICMLANEAADAILQGVATVSDIDLAMKYGTNYPRGPLKWADALSISYVAEVLRNLSIHYGEERYRISPLIQRKAITEGKFYVD